jgi:hypothetical protein
MGRRGRIDRASELDWKDIAESLGGVASLIRIALALYVINLLRPFLPGLVDRPSKSDAPVPEGAFGVTHRPDILLTLVGDALAQGRAP